MYFFFEIVQFSSFQTELFEDSSESSSSSSSSEEDEDTDSEIMEDAIFMRQNTKRQNIQNYVEHVVANYSEIEFREHFRVSRETAAFLTANVVGAQLVSTIKFGRAKITAEKAVLATLWYLANTETFRQLSDRFNMSKSTAHTIIQKITSHFALTSPNYIKWPSDDEMVQIERGFRSKAGVPGVVGAIDGTHIKIIKPILEQEAYYNRKGYHSILLQVICDHKKRFTDIFAGEAGSQHDGRVLRKSSVYEKGCNRTLRIGEHYILGDSAYPCLEWLVPPYRDDGNLTPDQHRFNYKHSSSRITVEHSIGLLKNRFRRLLHGFSNVDINFILNCVVCSCVFHNICITFDDLGIEFDEDPLINEGGIVPEGGGHDQQAGINKRNLIFHRMFPNN